MLEEYDVVELAEDLGPGLEPGTRGAVVMVFSSDPPEYEVEFVDDDGQTIGVHTVRANQVRKLAAPPRPRAFDGPRHRVG